MINQFSALYPPSALFLNGFKGVGVRLWLPMRERESKTTEAADTKWEQAAHLNAFFHQCLFM